MGLRALLVAALCVALIGPPPLLAQPARPAAVSTTIGVLGGAFTVVAVANGSVGAETICAGEGAALSVFKLQPDNTLARVARLELSDLVRDVEVVGSTAFVADGSAGLLTVDLSDKSAPRVLSSLPTAAAASSLRVAGGVAYVVVEGRGLQLVDVRDSARPATLSFVPLSTLAGLDWLGGVDVSGGYAYVGGSALQVVDVRDPTRPTPRGSVAIFWGSTALRVEGDRAYVARHYYRDPVLGGFVDVIDLRDPDRPVILGTFYGLGLVYDLRVRGDTLVAAGTAGVQQLDLRSAYDQPALTALPITGIARSVALGDSYAYVTVGVQVHVLRIQQGNAFVPLSSVAGQGTPISVVQSGDRAYTIEPKPEALSSRYVLRVVDVGQGVPKERGTVSLSRRAAFAITGTLAYAATDDNRFQVFDVASDQPALQSDIELPGFPTAVAARGAYAYVARGGAGGFQVVDVSNSAAPQLRGQIATSDGTTSIRVVGDTAYLGGNGLQIVDVRNADRPELVGRLDIVGWLSDIQVSDSYVYASVEAFNGSETTLLALDVSAPRQPHIAGTLPLPHSSYLRAAAGGTLFVASGDALLLVDAATLTPRGAVHVPGGAQGVAPMGDVLLVASGAGGLRALRVGPSAFTRVYLPLAAR